MATTEDRRRTVGRSTKTYRRIREEIKAQGLPCYQCGQPIDYMKPWPHPDSFSVDHVQPLSRHADLAEDPSNLVPCHLHCNQSKGTNDMRLSLGNRSEAF